MKMSCITSYSLSAILMNYCGNVGQPRLRYGLCTMGGWKDADGVVLGMRQRRIARSSLSAVHVIDMSLSGRVGYLSSTACITAYRAESEPQKSAAKLVVPPLTAPPLVPIKCDKIRTLSLNASAISHDHHLYPSLGIRLDCILSAQSPARMSSNQLHDGGDDDAAGMSSKKRKVPAFHVGPGRDGDFDDFPRSSSPVRHSEDRAARPYNLKYRFHRSAEAIACSFRKAVFLRRKAALISLYLDAQSAILADSKKGGTTYRSKLPLLPEVPAFEAMIPALEEIGLNDWAPDRPGWRNGWDDDRAAMSETASAAARVSRPAAGDRWRTGYERRKRRIMNRKPIARGGWMPEGSFEFEMPCSGGSRDSTPWGFWLTGDHQHRATSRSRLRTERR